MACVHLYHGIIVAIIQPVDTTWNYCVSDVPQADESMEKAHEVKVHRRRVRRSDLFAKVSKTRENHSLPGFSTGIINDYTQPFDNCFANGSR